MGEEDICNGIDSSKVPECLSHIQRGWRNVIRGRRRRTQGHWVVFETLELIPCKEKGVEEPIRRAQAT